MTKKEPELKGAVQGVRCVRDGRSGLGKGIAYLLLRDTEAAKAAVRVGKELEMVGRKLRVTRALAKPPGKEGAAGKGGKGGKVVKGVKGDKGGRGGATREKSSAPPRQVSRVLVVSNLHSTACLP